MLHYPQYFLGIETTCDDTSIGIYDAKNNQILANETISSADFQKQYGGVVPELAARYHERNINLVFINALKKAELDASEIDYLVYSSTPGFPGCLFVGKVFADFLHFVLNKPLIGVNHIHAHIFSAEIEQVPAKFPALGVVVSGGHTSIFQLQNYNELTLLNETHDDAIGEVYDKVARAMKLEYPGGPKIDQLFDPRKVNERMFNFSNKQHDYLSFSGLKTAVFDCINKGTLTTEKMIIVASTFQKKIIDILINFLKKYLSIYYQTKFILIGGGVSANMYLRSSVKKLGVKVLVPKLKYTNDNGAMIAYYGAKILINHHKYSPM